MSFLRTNRSRSPVSPTARSARGRRALNVPLILGGLAIIGVFCSVFYVMSSMSRQYTYFVATREVPAGSYLTADEVQTETGTGDPSGPNIITNVDDMNARLGTLVIRELLPNDVLEYSSVYFHRPESTASDNVYSQQYAWRFTEILPAGSRAVVITGDPTTTYVRAGDYVDVYYAGTDPIAGVTVRLMYQAQVLYAIPQPDPANNANTGGASVPTGTSFVLDLTPQQAQDLIWAQVNGNIRVALAAPDVTPNAPVVITDQTYFDQTYGTPSGITPGASGSAGASLPPLSGATAAPTSGIPGLPSPAPSK